MNILEWTMILSILAIGIALAFAMEGKRVDKEDLEDENI
jgi:hypothetical protein